MTHLEKQEIDNALRACDALLARPETRDAYAAAIVNDEPARLVLFRLMEALPDLSSSVFLAIHRAESENEGRSATFPRTPLPQQE